MHATAQLAAFDQIQSETRDWFRGATAEQRFDLSVMCSTISRGKGMTGIIGSLAMYALAELITNELEHQEQGG